jgi:hypothetical protein
LTIANDIISLSLRNSGVNGVGQTPMSIDIADSFKVLNAWINEINLERVVKVNRINLPTFPDLTTDVPFWSPYEHVLLTSMAVRLRQVYSLPPVQLDVQLAASALLAFNAINLEQIAAPWMAADDGSGYGVVFLALRAAGRVKDDQGVAQNAQDVTDAFSLLTEMLDEWTRERTVRVIPGQLPAFPNLAARPVMTPGVRNAIVLNLAVRVRDAFGAEVSKTLTDRAERALSLIQAINQQQIAALFPAVPETVEHAIFLALRMAGRINDQQSVAYTSKDVSDAMGLLVMMLGQWQRKRWLLWSEQDTSFVSTGANYYTIGPRQNFDVARPDKIHAAYVRILSASGAGSAVNDVLPETLPFPLGPYGTDAVGTGNDVDIPLAIIESREDWSTITIKHLKSIPEAVFYDSAWPIGRLYFWPVPPANAYELHLAVKTSLPVYGSLTDQLNLPPEYLDAVVNNLACRIIVVSGGQISPFLAGQARASLETVRMANVQIPLLGMPAALVGHRGDASSWAGRGLNQAWTTGGGSVLS